MSDARSLMPLEVEVLVGEVVPPTLAQAFADFLEIDVAAGAAIADTVDSY